MAKTRRFQIESLEARALLAADLGMEPLEPVDPLEQAEFASVDGTGNNLANPDWGSTHE